MHQNSYEAVQTHYKGFKLGDTVLSLNEYECCGHITPRFTVLTIESIAVKIMAAKCKDDLFFFNCRDADNPKEYIRLGREEVRKLTARNVPRVKFDVSDPFKKSKWQTTRRSIEELTCFLSKTNNPLTHGAVFPSHYTAMFAPITSGGGTQPIVRAVFPNREEMCEHTRVIISHKENERIREMWTMEQFVTYQEKHLLARFAGQTKPLARNNGYRDEENSASPELFWQLAEAEFEIRGLIRLP